MNCLFCNHNKLIPGVGFGINARYDSFYCYKCNIRYYPIPERSLIEVEDVIKLYWKKPNIIYNTESKLYNIFINNKMFSLLNNYNLNTKMFTKKILKHININ